MPLLLLVVVVVLVVENALKEMKQKSHVFTAF